MLKIFARRRSAQHMSAVVQYIKKHFVDLSQERYALKEDRDRPRTSAPSNEVGALIDAYRKNGTIPCDTQLSFATAPCFVDVMLSHMKSKNMTEPMLYKSAGIDRRLFSKMLSSKNYQPSKDTAIAVAIALKLTLPETLTLLSSAGYTISHSSKKDVVIEYFIKNQIYDIMDLNAVLYAIHEKILGRS